MKLIVSSFALSELVIDFIITTVDCSITRRLIFVCGVKKEHVAAHLALVQSAGIRSRGDYIDLFWSVCFIYAYSCIKEFASCALMMLIFYAIRILYTVNSCYVRSGSYQKVLCTTPKQTQRYQKRLLPKCVTSTAFFEDIVFNAFSFWKKV